MEDNKIAVAVDTYKMLAEIPRASSADIFKTKDKGHDVKVVLTARSYATMEKTVQRSHIHVNANGIASSSVSPAVDSSTESIKACFSSLPGSQSHWTVILRDVKCSSGKSKRLVELWKEERCYKWADVTEHHGEFIIHENYGSLSIHEDKVLYSAEGNAPVKEVDIPNRKDKSWPSSWDYVPSLGELSGGLLRPTVFMLDFRVDNKDKPRLCKLAVDDQETDPILSSAIFGQAIFSSSGKDILLTAYPTIQDGRRLGLIYCTNKPSAIYRASIEQDCGGEVADKEAVTTNAWIPRKWTRLSSSGVSARSPRSVAGEERCIWLQCDQGGAHRHCDALASYLDGSVNIEIPVVSIPDKTTGWAGLFSDTQLPKSCLLRHGTLFVTDTIQGCVKVLIIHQLGSKSTPTILTPISEQISLSQTARETSLIWSYKLLCTDGDSTIVAVRSSSLHPEQILLGTLEQDGRNVKWIILRDLGRQWEDDKDVQRLTGLECSVEEIVETKSETKGDQAVQAIVIRKAASSTIDPCILFPHGGPHGTDLIQWGPVSAALCLAGYTVALPNYHGSLGRGEQFVQSLIGKCGTLDVHDCKAVIDQLINKGVADKGKLLVMGGSHGGFLTTHLIGQYPSLFRRAVVRNPVIAVGQMEATSDIPEWCYSEFGFPFKFGNSPPQCPTAIQYEKMQSMSPVHQIDAIETPLLILMGLKDQRVPPSQSKLLYHRLLAKGKKVKMLAFENDQHALDGVEADLISFEATLRWYEASSQTR